MYVSLNDVIINYKIKFIYFSMLFLIIINYI